VLSSTVSNALKLTGGLDAAKFIEMCDKFFDHLNVDNLMRVKGRKKILKSHMKKG